MGKHRKIVTVFCVNGCESDPKIDIDALTGSLLPLAMSFSQCCSEGALSPLLPLCLLGSAHHPKGVRNRPEDGRLPGVVLASFVNPAREPLLA